MLVVGIVAVGLLVTLVVADVAGYIAAGVQAATAADAAALAAAPLTFHDFGGRNTPSAEASVFASHNGTDLVSCLCPIDRSWRSRTVEVVVRRQVGLALFGRRTIHALGRAQFVPVLLN